MSRAFSILIDSTTSNAIEASYASNATLNIINCIFDNNVIAGFSSAKNSTFTNNPQSSVQVSSDSVATGSVSFKDNQSNSVVHIFNSIFFNDSVSSTANCVYRNSDPMLVKANNSLFNDSSCSPTGSNNLIADPQLQVPSQNSGLPRVFVPLPGSPVIDAGLNSVCPATDQRGLRRPIDKLGKGSICDIGAVEVQ